VRKSCPSPGLKGIEKKPSALAALAQDENPGTHLIKGWVSPGAGLDNLERTKTFVPNTINPYPANVENMVSS